MIGALADFNTSVFSQIQLRASASNIMGFLQFSIKELTIDFVSSHTESPQPISTALDLSASSSKKSKFDAAIFPFEVSSSGK